ncbi:MAG: hypothetical protein RJA81_991 [Planctomycetota bacterium]
MNNCHCEVCGRSLGCQSEPRFIINLNVSQVSDLYDPVLPDQDTDPIDMMQHLIESCCDYGPEHQQNSRKFDLCCKCYEKFITDPFGKNSFRSVRFSSN